MKLSKIYFDAYKSLMDIKLDLNKDCIGFVGINESGKSNILNAVNILSGDRELRDHNTPKMDLNRDPQLRFEFTINDCEKEKILDLLQDFLESHSPVKVMLKSDFSSVVLTVRYNKKQDTIGRNFRIKGLELESENYVLKKEFRQSSRPVYFNDNYYRIDRSIIVNDKVMKQNKKLYEIYQEIKSLEQSFKQKNDNEEVNLNTDPKDLQDPELKRIAKAKKEKLSKVEDFELYELRNSIKDQISSKINDLDSIKNKLKNDSLNENQKRNIKSNKREREKELKDLRKQLSIFNTPFQDLYTKSYNLINFYLQGEINEILEASMPTVTFWEHKDNYVLQSEYEFEEIKKHKELNELSRPLVNVFRLTTSINSIDDLKQMIEHIQKNPNERSRLQKKITESVNNYIQSIWKEYDQDLHVSLEQERIRFEIYDSEFKDAHFYNMEERSQGCKTFISFLLTISAEAQKGVLQNAVLLLDEPEAHLHPSGVRFLLDELIKISKRNDNIVLYATHSEDMIDKKDYERHIIVEKDQERTGLKQSKKNRIGYFMQEEVLYAALDIDTSREVASENEFNFVFEGDGDVKIFEHYYREILMANKKPKRPFILKYSKFYQGGKCNSILKYFKQKPIQLGTKWIFILDNDKPAQQLKGFLEGKYGEYIDQDVFIFQYPNEFEDLVPCNLLINVYENIFDKMDITYKSKRLKELIEENPSYQNYNPRIMDEFVPKDKTAFKAVFKENFNKRLIEEVQQYKNEENFRKKFPKYYEWIESDVLKKLRDN